MKNKKTSISVNALDLGLLASRVINNYGFVSFVVSQSNSNFGYEQIFIKNIVKCFGDYKILKSEDCEVTEFGFDVPINILYTTNIPWVKYQTINRDYFINKNFEKEIVVEKEDIANLGIALFVENDKFVSFEMDRRALETSLFILEMLLKCFGDYKILDIEDGQRIGLTETVFVTTSLPIIDYGKPLGHVTQKEIDDYNKKQ